MIVIKEYNPKWAEEFETLREQLFDALQSRYIRIDHIGSTSVPGLGAKDIIDVQITVQGLSPKIAEKLISAGYQHHVHITHDHIPAGGNSNPRLWEKFVFSEPEGQRRAHIHVRVDGNPNQRYPLLFRDYLRAHPNSAKSVELIKRQLAKHHADDKEAYYDIKDPVYDLIWDAAQDWARYSGWKAD